MGLCSHDHCDFDPDHRIFCCDRGGHFSKYAQNLDMSMEELYQLILDLTGNSEFNGLILLIYAAVTSVIFWFWYRSEFLMRKKEKGWGAQFKLFGSYDYRYLIPGVILGVAAFQYGATYLMNILGMMFPDWLETYAQIMQNAGLGQGSISPVLVLYSVVLGPIAEELTYRGLTFGFARRNMTFASANFLQALLFGYLHGNMLQGCMAFALGLVFGYIMEKTDNLLLVILLHIAFNGFSTFAGNLIYSGNNIFGFYLSVFFGMTGTYFAILMITKGAEKKRVSDSPNNGPAASDSDREQ